MNVIAHSVKILIFALKWVYFSKAELPNAKAQRDTIFTHAELFLELSTSNQKCGAIQIFIWRNTYFILPRICLMKI